MSWRAFPLLLTLLACVGAPEAARDGGSACTSDPGCNGGASCGLIRRCVNGFCTDDTVFRACADGRYPDAGAAVGQCLTFVDCNRLTCGPMVPCIAQRCAVEAPRVIVPCGDAGAP